MITLTKLKYTNHQLYNTLWSIRLFVQFLRKLTLTKRTRVSSKSVLIACKYELAFLTTKRANWTTFYSFTNILKQKWIKFKVLKVNYYSLNEQWKFFFHAKFLPCHFSLSLFNTLSLYLIDYRNCYFLFFYWFSWL